MSPHAHTTITSPLSPPLSCTKLPSPIAMTSFTCTDKKRARPQEEFGHARKKVAGELMAFDFESLSLSNTEGLLTQDGSTGSHPRRHPPVQQHSLQTHHPEPLQRTTHGHVHTDYTVQQLQLQDQYQYQHQHGMPDPSNQHHQPWQPTLCQPQQQQQQRRGRTKSSPEGPSNRVAEQEASIHSDEGAVHASGRLGKASLFSSSPSVPVLASDPHLRPMPLYAQHLYSDSAAVISGSSSSSSFSPLSPPVSPPPSALSAAAVDESMMMMDESMSDIANDRLQSLSRLDSAATTQLGSTTLLSSTSSYVKVLNLRQRKWNSVSKEWQEWQEVQATHTPNLPAVSSVCDVQSDAMSGSTNPIPNGATSVSQRNEAIQSQWNDGQLSHYAPEDISATHSVQPSSGLGRQRSLQRAGDKARLDYSGSPMEQRGSFGVRARSFSETNICSYTLPQAQPQSQHHQDPHTLPNTHSQPQSSVPSPYQMAVSQEGTQSLGQEVPLHQHTSWPSGHPQRHHSDHGRAYFEDLSDRNYNGEEGRLGHFSHTSQPIQPSHGATGMANTHQQQHPWMALSMTSLDGTMNIPSDRFSRNPSSALSSAAASSMSTVSSSIAPAPPVSSSAPLSFSTGVRQDEPSNNWNQQLLKSHSGYRENYGGAMPRHGSYSRASPVHYGQHTYQQHFQHGHAHNHSFEDVSMGDETSRPMPSRSSSPAPCLSMVPTITRPLSISFSHLAGPNTLGNVSEHEHDDDMEL